SNSEASIRGWAVRLLVDNQNASQEVIRRFVRLARNDKSPRVRLSLASALQRLPLAQRWRLAEALAGQAEDTLDANLPLMLWYGMEPMVPADSDRAVKLLTTVRIPLVRRFIVRRITLLDENSTQEGKSLKLLTQVLAETANRGVQRDILRGMHEALQGRRRV